MMVRLAVHNNFVWVYAPYSVAFTEAIKRRVRTRKRCWIPQWNLWRIDLAYGDVLLTTVREHYVDYVWVDYNELVRKEQT